MTQAKIFPTIWPKGFNPDDQRYIASAIVVDRPNTQLRKEAFHRHETGQLTLAVRGLVSVAFPEGSRSVPVHCAVWTPPLYPHSGHLGIHSESIYLMVNPQACQKYALPLHPVSMVINAMTYEMLRYLAVSTDACEPGSENDAVARVILGQVAKAQVITSTFTPIPTHRVLQKLAQAIGDTRERRTNEQWASWCAMSERSLSRLVRHETGISFKRWRTQIVMMTCLTDLYSGVSVGQLAFNAGYETTSAFIAAFKRVFGMTPMAFKEKYF